MNEQKNEPREAEEYPETKVWNEYSPSEAKSRAIRVYEVGSDRLCETEDDETVDYGDRRTQHHGENAHRRESDQLYGDLVDAVLDLS